MANFPIVVGTFHQAIGVGETETQPAHAVTFDDFQTARLAGQVDGLADRALHVGARLAGLALGLNVGAVGGQDDDVARAVRGREHEGDDMRPGAGAERGCRRTAHRLLSQLDEVTGAGKGAIGGAERTAKGLLRTRDGVARSMRRQARCEGGNEPGGDTTRVVLSAHR
jgi:hypothetical protein